VRSQACLAATRPMCRLGLPRPAHRMKIEERYRAEGKTKDDVPIAQLRSDCREFATHWIGVQREQFNGWGAS